MWVFADVIESLKKGRYVKKDAKFLKHIEKQGDNNDELKDTDVFKDFNDCIKNLQDRSSDTQNFITNFFQKHPKNARAITKMIMTRNHPNKMTTMMMMMMMMMMMIPRVLVKNLRCS
jgi:hypothetical protein